MLYSSESPVLPRRGFRLSAMVCLKVAAYLPRCRRTAATDEPT